MVAERRRSPRYSVRDVQGSLLFVAEARVLDMSLTGMAVETDTRLRLDRTYSLRLRREDGQEVPLTATVMWCQLRPAHEGVKAGSLVYTAGLRFTDVLSAKAEKLVAFLQASAVITVQTRICGRFRARFRESVSLASEYEFEVRTVSSTGMLITSELEPEQGSVFDMDVKLNGDEIHTQGRIAYVRPAVGRSSAGRLELGVEFLGMNEPARSALLSYIGKQLG
jgi:hypothetical protein